MKRYLKAITLTATLAVPFMMTATTQAKEKAKWVSGDFHQHTFYTDGRTSFDFVMEKNNEFGLEWWANSEHGGARPTDGEGVSWLDTTKYPVNPILGDNPEAGYMYRWQSLRDFVYPDIENNRELYPDKKIASGLEWNVPNHEHCSTGIVAENASAISAFEFMFDKSDYDTSRIGEDTPYGELAKQNVTHENAVAGCAWMQQQLDAGKIDSGWIVFAHIERKGDWSTGGYNIENFRDFNNAGPDVCFGFEGAPGHQANSSRGGFGDTAFGGTYGGTGYYTATLGGLWDALLGEGRHWYNFASSDYHLHHTAGGDDFYPGEYQKTWTKAIDEDRDGDISLKEIADGLRSGNSYHVMGDLINFLEFSARSKSRFVEMGGDLHIRKHKYAKNPLMIKIKFKSPVTNNNGDTPVVDHIDLIAGDITGPVSPDSPDYTKATNETTRVMASFTAADWEVCEDGYNVITYPVYDLDRDTYFRLRGTNQPVDTPNETDADGNPLPDSMSTLDGPAEAWADLWFYSNPIFVYVNN